MNEAVVQVVRRTELTQFCHRWQIVEMALFGSVLREDFRPNSDIDLLVTFAPNTRWTLLDHMRMELELEDLFQRKVDLIDRSTLLQSLHPQRTAEILNTAQVIFSAPALDHALRS